MSNRTANTTAMGFFHIDGFVPSYRQATQFAGKTGHVGTMLDVIDARLATPPDSLTGHYPNNPSPWDQYYTTMSAEYVGMSKSGVKILIITHDAGPMSNEKGVIGAYKLDPGGERELRGSGRITIDEFHKLESGHYGPVSIVELDPYMEERKYPFISMLQASTAMLDPVMKARLGPRADEYLQEHKRLALQFHQEEHGLDPEDDQYDPFIIKANDPSNCSYVHRDPEDGYAFAHLLAIGQISHASSSDYGRWPAWSCDVSPHRWSNGTRMFGVREGKIDRIAQGPDASKLLLKHWRELMEDSGLSEAPDGPFVLMQMSDDTWFTQTSKQGARADTYEPEFEVVSIEKVGGPKKFYTESNYPVPVFRYDQREALAVLPSEVNAYELVGEASKTGGADSPETCLVQGYRVTINHQKRLMSGKVLATEFDRMMELQAKVAA